MGVVPVRQVQNNLRPEAEVLGRFVRPDEGEAFLAFVLPKVYRGALGPGISGFLRLRIQGLKSRSPPIVTWRSPKE
jgi:hypothetical protein